MATAALVGVPIDDGARLISALDRTDLSIPVAFWIYSSEWGEWRLALASALVDQRGPREVYRRVQNAMNGIPGLTLRLDQTWVVGLTNPLVGALRSLFRTDPGMSDIRLTNNVVNGLLIEDAYVYRLT